MVKKTVNGETVQIETEQAKQEPAEDKKPRWVAGQSPPEGVENPPPGERGHRCIDLHGKYNPKWRSVYIEKTPMVGSVQYFPENYRVRTGMWVDVPPEIVRQLEGCVIEVAEEDGGQYGIKPGSRSGRTRKVPRFQFSQRRSA